MGYNTTVVVMNDAIDQIRNDATFGRKLAEAILENAGTYRRVDVSAGNHANAAHVVEQHHADGLVVVGVGGNLGQVIGIGGHWRLDVTRPEDLKVVLGNLAARIGYRLQRMPQAKTSGQSG